MPKNRGLNLERFVESVPPDALDQYFARLPDDGRPEGWATINAAALAEWLDDPAQAERTALILKDFQKVNDLARGAAPSLYRACEQFGIPLVDEGEQPEGVALRLFVTAPEAFDFAWSQFLLYATGAKLSTFLLPKDKVLLDDDRVASFSRAISGWLAGQAKGQQCRVRRFMDGDEAVILVQRGTYVQTVPFWNGDQIAMQSFRPAIEDVLVWEPEGFLRIRSSLSGDRRAYLYHFAAQFAGDTALAEQAERTEIYSLVPLQDGSFHYRGFGNVVQVDLVKARLKLFGGRGTVIDIRSSDVLESMRSELRGRLSLESGTLTMARLRVHIRGASGRERTITFEIEPPGRTDLTEREDTDQVIAYLKQEGVMLR